MSAVRTRADAILRREPVSTSLENALSAHEVAVRLAALYHLAAIRIERIVDDPLRRILCVVVLEAEMPEAFCDSFEPWTLWLVVQRVVGIGAVDDPPKQHQRGILCQLVLFQDGFERAFLAVMAKLNVFDVVGNGVEAFRLSHHLLCRHKHELGVLVDELLDQPGAGDAVDLDLFSGDPFHPYPPVWLLRWRSSVVQKVLD